MMQEGAHGQPFCNDIVHFCNTCTGDFIVHAGLQPIRYAKAEGIFELLKRRPEPCYTTKCDSSIVPQYTAWHVEVSSASLLSKAGAWVLTMFSDVSGLISLKSLRVWSRGMHVRPFCSPFQGQLLEELSVVLWSLAPPFGFFFTLPRAPEVPGLPCLLARQCCCGGVCALEIRVEEEGGEERWWMRRPGARWWRVAWSEKQSRMEYVLHCGCS